MLADAKRQKAGPQWNGKSWLIRITGKVACVAYRCVLPRLATHATSARQFSVAVRSSVSHRGVAAQRAGSALPGVKVPVLWSPTGRPIKC